MKIGANYKMASSDSDREISSEITVLKKELTKFERRGNLCYGFIEGDKSQMEEFLDNFMSMTSTCFVRSQCHDKAKGHKRFSNSGKKEVVDQPSYTVNKAT